MTDTELTKMLRSSANRVVNYAADRIEVLTAERDRYRKALEDIIADCEADYPPSHGAIKYAAHAALKGESK